MDMLKILFYMYHVCMKTVPDFTKLRLIKGPKSKFPGEVYPRTSLVYHMLCTRIRTCPPPQPLPNNLYNLILLPPPIWQKAERNPDYVCMLHAQFFPPRLRYAFGYDAANNTAANFFFWFMHSITLTLHGMQ